MALACCIRAAKEPFGGGLDETGAVFTAAGFGPLEFAGGGLETVGLVAAGFTAVCLVGASRADRAVPVDVVPLL